MASLMLCLLILVINCANALNETTVETKVETTSTTTKQLLVVARWLFLSDTNCPVRLGCLYKEYHVDEQASAQFIGQ